MKEYKFKEEIKIVNNQKHEVIIPEKHSTIDALILKTINLNAWDDWANIPNWHTLCKVLKKGEKDWETLYDGSTRGFKINDIIVRSLGIYNVLYLLENRKVRNNIFKKEQIKELENRIKKDTKRLQILKGDKNEKK